MSVAWVRAARRLCLAAAGALLLARVERAPLAVLAALMFAPGPLVRAWRGARGTALRASVVWAGLAVGLAIIAEALAATEPLGGGRPMAGHVAYLSVLATLAGLISVLNARTPGGGAWAILMALLILVFMIPWLEGGGLGRAPGGLGRLRLDHPWTIFYGLLVLAGVTNYLPTKYGPTAAWLGLGFLLEYLGLTRAVGSASGRATVWTALPWTLAAAVATADTRSGPVRAASNRLEDVWFWFRDHWGVVWALRVQERFNRSAESSGWPVRLAWHGLVSAGDGRPAAADVPGAAEKTLRGLLRRFALPERIDRAVADAGASPLVNAGAVADDGGGETR